jgi:hypothetical protein
LNSGKLNAPDYTFALHLRKIKLGSRHMELPKVVNAAWKEPKNSLDTITRNEKGEEKVISNHQKRLLYC